MSSASPGYRADIDGLRAVAVLAVVWFHSGLPGLPSGFLGVDVFFVISGYLIAGIIQREIAAGVFRFAAFYERRVRRIAPALLVVLAVTLAVGAVVLLTGQLLQLGRSAVAALLMVPNLFFWIEAPTGYFGLAKRLPPLLLHLWSLGVEEQFYLLFPAFMLICARLRITRIAVVLGIAASFGLYLAAMVWRPEAAFFLLPTRAWELGLGALLAREGGAIPQRWRSPASYGGALLILLALPMPDGQGAWQPWLTTAAAIGSTLLIAGAPASRLGQWLALPPIVGLGRISYSLYLWHWPVFLLLRQVLVTNELPVEFSAFGIALSLGLAWLTWRWIEQPARARSVPFIRVAAVLAGGYLLVLGAALAFALSGGWPSRFTPQELALAHQAKDQAPLVRSCEDARLDELARKCTIGTGPPRVAIWGDSHAVADSAGIAAGFGQTTVVLSTGGCAPSLGLLTALPGSIGAEACTKRNRAVLDWLMHQPQIGTVVLVARWPAYRAYTGADLAGGVQAAVDALRGKHVWIVAGTPDPGVDVPWAQAVRLHLHRAPFSLPCTPPGLAIRGATVIDLSAAFCAHPRPWTLFFDGSHPSLTANREVIAPAVQRAVLASGEFDASAAAPYPRAQ